MRIEYLVYLALACAVHQLARCVECIKFAAFQRVVQPVDAHLLSLHTVADVDVEHDG